MGAVSAPSLQASSSKPEDIKLKLSNKLINSKKDEKGDIAPQARPPKTKKKNVKLGQKALNRLELCLSKYGANFVFCQYGGCHV